MGRRDLSFAPNQREAAEMTLLRMIAFQPSQQTAQAASGGAGSDSDRTPASIAAPSPVQTQIPIDNQSSSAAASAERKVSASTGQTDPVQAAPLAKPAVESTGKNEPVAGSEAEATVAVTVAWSAENWSSILEQLRLSGMPRQLAQHCSLKSFEGDVITLGIESAHEHLNSQRFASRLSARISQAVGRDISLVIDSSDEALDTPARQDQQQKQEALDEARSAIQGDPIVKTLLEKVDGVVDEDSVKPL